MPRAQPDAEKQVPLPALVIEVEGSVDWAVAGVSPLAKEGWTPVKVGDRLNPTTQMRTGLRSHVNLQFGESTTISVRSATFAGIEQFYRSANTETVRMGLGYGTIRGGSSEGEFRSEVTVDSPVATLAKRGTEGWELRVEPGTGRYNVSLAEYGLVEARHKLRDGNIARTKSVRPGEYANPGNIANLWINQDIFDRTLRFYPTQGVTEADAEFTQDNSRGMGVMAPGGGSTLTTYSGRSTAAASSAARADDPPRAGPIGDTIILEPGPITRPDGNFGTGRSFRVLRPDSLSQRRR